MNLLPQINLGKKIILSNFNLLRFPYKLTFAITYKCQSKCRHCGIWKKKPKNELKLDEIKEFAKRSSFFSWYNLTGGEPFLRKDIVDIVTTFLENSKDFYLLNMTTNGLATNLVHKKVEEILSLDIPRIVTVVSLDGPREINDNIRGISGSHDKAIQTYQLLRNLSKDHKNFQTFLGYTITSLNLGKIEDTISSVKEFIPDVKPRDFHFNLFHVSKHYYTNVDNDLLNYKERVMKDLETIERVKESYFNPIQFLEEKYVKLAKEFIKAERTPLKCKAISTSLFLDPEGNVFPCTIFDKKLGNIRDFRYDLKELLKLKSVEHVKKEVRELKCPGCWTPCEAYQIILGNFLKVNIPF
jgi:MoaA/NifB/PqqE/SkfB family radical SAM enzyme